MRKLIVPSHTVSRYKERVITDKDAKLRTADEIRLILGFSLFLGRVYEERIRPNSHFLVDLTDPLERASFGQYYLVLNPAIEGDGSIVCETIKNIGGVLEDYFNKLEFFRNSSPRLRRSDERARAEKRRIHYARYW